MTKQPKIKDVDRGYRELMRRMDRIAKVKPEVVVGIMGQSAYEQAGDDATVLDIALFHELGMGVPRRSWLRDWYDERLPANRKRIKKLARMVLKGELDERRALELFGVRAVASIRRRIRKGIPPALSEVTIERKGSATPLIDTGQLIRSITHEVRP
ncbi:MAG: hypothetical protein ACODAG_02995 [Myxococcota bacterium]